MADDPNPNPQPDKDPKDPPSGSEKKWTDTDVDKFKGTARQEGRSAGESAERERWVQQLGVKDLKEAKKLITDQRQAQEGKETDDKEKDEQIRTANERAETAEKLAERRLVDAELKLALIDAGVPKQRISDALTLAPRDGISVGGEAGDKVEGLDKVVDGLKESKAYLFEAGVPQQKVPRRAPDANTQPDPAELDVSGMSREEFNKLQDRVSQGEKIAPSLGSAVT